MKNIEEKKAILEQKTCGPRTLKNTSSKEKKRLNIR